MEPMRTMTVYFGGCPGRPLFYATGPIANTADPEFLEICERRMVDGVLRDTCPVTGQRFRAENHTGTAIDVEEPWLRNDY